MGYLNLSSSLRYGVTGKRKKRQAFTKKSKRTIYNELIATQQRQYDKVVKQVAQEYLVLYRIGRMVIYTKD